MNHSTSNDSEIGSEGCPSKPISTLADLEVKAYDNRVRERLTARCPTGRPVEVRRLEKQIERQAEGDVKMPAPETGGDDASL